MEKRKVKRQDCHEIAVLLKKVYEKAPWFDKWKDVKQVEKYVIELMDNPVFRGYILEESETIIGVCMGHKKTWFESQEFVIDEFFIEDTIHGKGIGSQLMKFVKKELSKEGIMQLLLLTGKGFPAQSFYEKHGFYVEDKTIVMVNKP